MEKTLYVVDGFALIFRAYYAFIKRPLINSKQQNTGAVFGFFRMLFRVIKEYTPEDLVVVFDGKKTTFRHQMYKEYKANRAKAPEDLLEQIPWVVELVHELGIPSVTADGLEADDLIAAFAAHCRKKGYLCRIFSGDKDLMQLVGERVEMLVPKPAGNLIQLYRSAEVEEKFGVTPEMMADYLALVGDSSDNVPGVKGIGPKGAVKLLQAYQSLDGIYAHLDEIKPDGTRKKLQEQQDEARLSYSLVHLDRSEPLPLEENSWKLPRLGGEKGVSRLQELELHTLLEDPLLQDAAGSVQTEDTGSARQELSWETVTTVEQLENLVERLSQVDLFALDTETTSLNPLDADLVGISFSFEEYKGYYIPVRHRDNPLPAEQVLEKLRPLLEDGSIGKVGQNLKYDMRVLKRAGIELSGIRFDTMIAAYLLEAGSGSGRVNLDALALRYFNHQMIPFKELVPDKDGTILDAPLEKTAEYAAEDASVTWLLYSRLAPELRKAELEQLFEQIEMPLLPVLAEMEQNGVQLDRDHFAALSQKIEERLEQLSGRIYSIAGEEFNLNSPKQLSAVLFEKLQIPPVKKTKTGYSTDEGVLQQLADDWEIAAVLLEYRKLYKLQHTYLAVLPELIHPQTGRIHTSFNQTVTATGRLSSSDPNLQNIPIRDQLGREVRRGFTAPQGYQLISADYSQIELRILAAMSGDKALQEAYNSGEDIHRRTAARIFAVTELEVSREQRSFAKAINFGVVYGLSAFGLSRDLKIPRHEAQQYIDTWFRLHAGVADFIEETGEQAAADQSVTTWFGRRRILPDINSRNRMKRDSSRRLAVNTRIQGTAADLIKLAMTGTAAALRRDFPEAKLLLQVHDELLIEVPQQDVEAVSQLVRRQMTEPWPFDVPLEVGVGCGADWDAAH